VGTTFLNPFQLTPSGSIATTSDPQQINMQRVESLIGTPPGERVMLPTYGVNIPAVLFAPDIEAEINEIENDVTQAIAVWEPSINVTDITPVAIQQNVGVIGVNIEFQTSTLTPDFTPIQTATVLVGGTVVQN
jgi:uncharacterized protein